MNPDIHPTFTTALRREDFDLSLAAAREHEAPMPVVARGQIGWAGTEE